MNVELKPPGSIPPEFANHPVWQQIDKLPEPWRSHFLTEPWKPWNDYMALSQRVLIVATTRCEGAWAAYIDSVPGYSHSAEWRQVLHNGTKAPEAIARYCFPALAEIPYAP